jgi:hypothetical protein
MKYYRNPNPRPKNRVFVVEETHGAGPRTWQAYGEATVATVDGYKVAYLSRSFSNEQGQAGRDIPLNQATRFYALKADGTPDLDAYASKQSRGWSLTGCGEYGSDRVSNRREALANLAQVNLHDDRTGNPPTGKKIRFFDDTYNWPHGRLDDLRSKPTADRMATRNSSQGWQAKVEVREFKSRAEMLEFVEDANRNIGKKQGWGYDESVHWKPLLREPKPSDIGYRTGNPASKPVMTVLEFAETAFSGNEQYTVYGEATVATINGCKVAYVSRFPHTKVGQGKPIPLSAAFRFFPVGADGKPDFRLEVTEQYPYQPAGHRGAWLIKVGLENGLPQHIRPLHHAYHKKEDALSALCEIKRQLDAHEGSRTGNPAASRFVLLDAGPSEGHHGAHDRYTLIDTLPYNEDGSFREPRFGDSYLYLGFGPGVSEHGEMTARDFNALKAERFRSLGKRIKIESLPANLRRLAEQFIADESTR